MKANKSKDATGIGTPPTPTLEGIDPYLRQIVARLNSEEKILLSARLARWAEMLSGRTEEETLRSAQKAMLEHLNRVACSCALAVDVLEGEFNIQLH